MSNGERPEVAVVTGGASGFGLALATRFAQHGMAVGLLDLDGERAAGEAAGIATAHGVETLGLAVNVADDASVQAAAQAVNDRFGRADLVMSNVGVQLFGSVERLTDREWQWVLDVNVVGAARIARAFIPLLRQAPRGRLGFTTSSSVLDPASRLGAYQASKFALWGLAETLALELKADDIAVSIVFPSGMVSRHLESSTAAQPEDLRRAIGEPEDFEVMMASNPEMVQAPVDPDEAAANVVEALLAGERYIITHGDLTGAVTSRDEQLLAAARRAAG
ncbi:MAG TPA: SDR family NAD(P)-dependent oxidoreductase [Frankiaceae bacterium]|jgi:NAD(P)-dependent dehydrogenase (short-subunit alcohol dehydrogenase family)|nr:SDR family NAD(P)-dependent oxidoreductase [Frankiaceae bacterium]